jgi:hypothetical protein
MNVGEWVTVNSPSHLSKWVKNHLPIAVCKCELTSRFQCVSEWELTSWFECVCVWMRENSPPHLCLWVRERPHLPSALPSNHTLDNLLVNRILDGRIDGHTRFNAETLNPKPGHTQEDTHYTEWYRYPEFSETTQEFTHYTKGPCFPHKQTGH